MLLIICSQAYIFHLATLLCTLVCSLVQNNIVLHQSLPEICSPTLDVDSQASQSSRSTSEAIATLLLSTESDSLGVKEI
ncbi:hypothetical protein M758_5G095000 [Ceratodon purpureus]|nr:hypothetical protein M758_5G095000 [Ceratodon purpureus]